jgi:predicted lipid-binding transport protein (Tim44 family)
LRQGLNRGAAGYKTLLGNEKKSQRTEREAASGATRAAPLMAAFGALAGVLVGTVITGIGSHFQLRFGDIYGNTFSEMHISNAIFFKFSVWKLIL